MERTPTNIRALLILEAISRSNKSLTPTEINEELGLPKQSVHRLCSYLVELGFLVNDGQGNGLRPSARTRRLANGLLLNSHEHIVRHQILQEVSDAVQETVNFVQPEESGMCYRDRVQADWPFQINLPTGSNVPFHCTASGKVYLASMTPQARRKFVEGYVFKRLTENTIMDKEKFLEELRQVRKQKFALDNQEFMIGMVAVSVPVLDPEGRYFASLAFHGPTPRLTIERAAESHDALLVGAQKLTALLFDSPQKTPN